VSARPIAVQDRLAQPGPALIAFRESDRLTALAPPRPRDTAKEPVFDTIVALAAGLFNTQLASITLVDDHRRWLREKLGQPHAQQARSESLCAVVMAQNRPLLVGDARLDPRFADLPAVREGVFVSYAGVPIAGRDGLVVGALSVLDTRPRDFAPSRIQVLRSLAQLVGDELDLRRRDAKSGVNPVTARKDTEALLVALEHNQLRVFFQPIIDLASGRAHSVEALVRWQHPSRGLLPPGAFLPLAEVAGMAHAIDLWVLRAATEMLAGWRRRLPEAGGVSLAVNVALGTALGEHWDSEVRESLALAGLPPEALVLEVSERSVDAATAATYRALEALAEHGCRIAIADLDTATSSLARLADLPASQIKIEPTLISTIRSNARSRAMVAAIARLGRGLELDVVAEGVEDENTAELVALAGCTSAQGYLWSPPIPAQRTPELLAWANR